MRLKLLTARHLRVWLVVLTIKFFKLLLTDREEHSVVHGLYMILDVTTGKDMSAILHNIDEEDDHSNANEFNGDDFSCIKHFVM